MLTPDLDDYLDQRDAEQHWHRAELAATARDEADANRPDWQQPRLQAWYCPTCRSHSSHTHCPECGRRQHPARSDTERAWMINHGHLLEPQDLT